MNVINQFFWMIPTTLIILAILQSIYWIFLLRGVNRPKRASTNSPVMPSSPQNARGGADAQNVNEGTYTDSTGRTNVFRGVMIVHEGLHTDKIPMPKSSFSMGRFYNPDEDILIALDERSISRRHARFITEGNNYYITDLGSSYGTSVLINGAFSNLSPDQREQVYNGDVVLFGNSVKVELSIPGPLRRS